MKRGQFIVLEGIDGCGSTTQARRLAHVLASRGTEVCHTFEPSDGPVGSLIRRALKRRLEHDGQPRELSWASLALLFSADRLDHVDSVIEPALARGATVISDRYDLSSLAYQSVTAAPEGSAGADTLAWIQSLNRYARRPDLTIILDVPAEVAEARRRSRGGEHELFEVSDLQRQLAGVYAQGEELVPHDKVVHVDGSGAPEAVGDAIMRAVMGALAGAEPVATPAR